MKTAIFIFGLLISTTGFAQSSSDACNQKIMAAGFSEVINSMSASEIASSIFNLNFAGGPDASGAWHVSVNVESIIDGSSKIKSLNIGVEPTTCTLTPRLPVK